MTRPMKEPAIAATLLMPRARPLCSAGKASVRMAAELARRNAAPSPWPILQAINHRAAVLPVSQVEARSTENTVKITKPRLYMRARP